MAYLSDILGRRVVDAAGETVGRIVDLAVTVEEPFGGVFPPVTLALVKAGGATLRLRSELLGNLATPGDVHLLDDRERAPLTIGAEKSGEVYLRRDVLDKQIIDIRNYRLVRVNDVFLVAESEGEQNILRAAGVDVSFRGLLRRIRFEKRVVPLMKKLGVAAPRQTISWNEMEVMQTESGGKIQLKVPTDKLARLHPTDLAMVVQQMSPGERSEVIGHLDDETVATALEEMDDEIAADIVEGLDQERAADILEKMDPDEAADVLGEMDSESETDEILRLMDDPEEAAEIKHLLSYEEGTAGALMTTDVVEVPRGFSAAQVFEKLRAEQPDADSLHYLYVVQDGGEKLLGILSLAEIALAAPETPLENLMRDSENELITVEADADSEECARLIAKYDLLSLPVIDENGALLGAVTVDDVIDEIAPDARKMRLPYIFARHAEDD